MFGFDPYPNKPDTAAGGDFFDYVIQAASGPIGTLAHTMDPYSLSSSGGGLGVTPFPYNGVSSGGDWLANAASSLTTVRPRPAASSQNGYSGQIGVPTTTSTRIAQKIFREFSSRGLDGNFALWVAENEGGLDDAAANRRNAQGSHAYGPFQLLLGGGLGDEALQSGIDPRDARSVDRQIAWVADYVARNGWSKWEAVTARGIDPWTGVRSRASVPAAPVAAPVQGPAPSAPAVPMPTTPTGASGYALHSTTPASQYTVAFDFDAPYSNPFSAAIPRHRGVDLVVRGAPNGGRGSRVGAFHSGTVVAVTNDRNGGRGVIIQGDDGLYHRYFHFDSVVAQHGQRIERGTPLGILGASGTEGFPHLHYEVSRRLNGDPMGSLIDPRPYLRGAY